MATLQEKRDTIINIVDSLDADSLDRMYNYVISLNPDSEIHIKHIASKADVQSALDMIDKKYSEDMRILAQ